MADLNQAQAQLDEKQKELDIVQAKFDAAMAEKQVMHIHSKGLLDMQQFILFFIIYRRLYGAMKCRRGIHLLHLLYHNLVLKTP